MRKERVVTIDEEGRDKGRTFHIQELPATESVAMIDRMMVLCANAGVDVGKDIFRGGARGLILAVVQALPRLNYDEVAPLLKRGMAGVTIISDPATAPNHHRALVENDIEEVSTWYRLRMEMLDLHTGFLASAGPSPSREDQPGSTTATNSTTSNSSNTRISRAQPGRSSRQAARA